MPPPDRVVMALFVDARAGGFALDAFLAALVDLGVAPSPVLHAVHGMGLPVEVRAEAGGVSVLAREETILSAHEALYVLDALPLEAARLAEDALGRLLVDEAGRRFGDADTTRVLVEARSVALLAAAATGVASLRFDDALLTRAPDATPEGAAFLAALAPAADPATGEPRWAGPVARGEARGGRVRVALGPAYR